MTNKKKERDYLTINGNFISHKIIKADNPLLILIKFQVDTEQKTAIIAKNALSFIEKVHEGDGISLYGYYNKRHQFVVSKYLVQAKPHQEFPAHLKYPSKRHPNDSL